MDVEVGYGAEAIRTMISNNVPAGKHGDALLARLPRFRRCGRKLTVRYTGAKHNIPRCSCSRGWLDHGEPRCIAFGDLRIDDAVEAARRRDEVREALRRDLEAARYAVDRAIRQYDASDPANRLVTAELEARCSSSALGLLH